MSDTVIPPIQDWVVLVVDDDPDNLEVAHQLLDGLGAKVHLANNGKEGLTILDTLTPSFILLDLSMPDMSGWDMLKHIRERANGDAIPIIALTAHAMAGDLETALSAGFDGYITKPYPILTFADDITRFWKDKLADEK